MRIWSFHPKYLDNIGHLRSWNEGKTAQNALIGLTLDEKRGYYNHSQLIRFKNSSNALQNVCNYLWTLVDEYNERPDMIAKGYPKAFLASSIVLPRTNCMMPVNNKQLDFEVKWFKEKLVKRNTVGRVSFGDCVDENPIFYSVNGDVENWERIII